MQPNIKKKPSSKIIGGISKTVLPTIFIGIAKVFGEVANVSLFKSFEIKHESFYSDTLSKILYFFNSSGVK